MLNAYLKQYLILSDTDIGDFNTFIFLAMTMFSYIAGYFTDRFGAINTLMIYDAIAIAGVFLLTQPKPYIYLSVVLIGSSISFWVTSLNALSIRFFWSKTGW